MKLLLFKYRVYGTAFIFIEQVTKLIQRTFKMKQKIKYEA